MNTIWQPTCCLVILLVCLGLKAEPVGTAFSYQGYLELNNVPASGDFDVLFRLYDAVEDGSQLDSLSIDDLSVVDGLLAAELDFGDLPFSGEAVWLSISIRQVADPELPYQVLDPRQRLNTTPYAIQSSYVENGIWSVAPQGIFYTGGTVAITAANAGQNLMNVQDNSFTTRFRIHGNGGASIGSNTQPSPAGLYVQGDADLAGDLDVGEDLFVSGSPIQAMSSHGFVKAGATVNCAATGASLIRSFNHVNSNNISVSSNGIPGRCDISFPFQVSQLYLQAHAKLVVAPGVAGRTVSCLASNNNVLCQSFNASNGDLIDATIELLLY